MKKIKILLAFVVLALVIASCKHDDYFVGGTLHNAKVNMTTYDYLKSNKDQLFDTLLLIVDKTGTKDKINQAGATFFAPTDYSIKAYLLNKTLEAQRKDPTKRYTIDTLIKYDLSHFTDSVNVYIIPSKVEAAALNDKGTLFQTAKSTVKSVVSFEYTDDPNLGYNPNSANRPQIMYYTFLKKTLTPPIVASEISSSDGVRTRVQTSGIETTTGMLHVLENGKTDRTGHILYFSQKRN
ncbi:MAG: hypothetical protein EOO91_05225 [Pedobacter sp.]|nr:MAG: hypothetical protein EOO91_05225 [Pedobacter sp.]